MKNRIQVAVLCLLVSVFPDVDLRGQEQEGIERAVSAMMGEVDRGVLLEHYRHLRMEIVKGRLEQAMVRMKMDHADDSDRAEIQKMLAMQSERLALLGEHIELTRRELVEVVRLSVQAGGKVPAPGKSGMLFDGVWRGEAPDGDSIRMEIGGGRARFNRPGVDEHWFDCDFRVEQRDDGLWNVTLRIDKGSEGEVLGKVSLGLAKVGEDELVWALGEPGEGERPDSLDRAAAGAPLLRMRRE
ncbi:MAG: hypothetical protein RI897_1335 [Verrucomicrobiota bacterium]|jgi:hypothetical protein